MHQLNVGIEHLFTGLQVEVIAGPGKLNYPLVFERESASIVRLLCEQPFRAYWPVKQSWLESHEVPEGSTAGKTRYTTGEVEWYAQALAPAMASCDSSGRGDELRAANPQRYGPMLPEPVVRAMRAKFGALANNFMHPSVLSYDGLSKYWGFSYAGMFHGVEPDGYIHT